MRKFFATLLAFNVLFSFAQVFAAEEFRFKHPGILHTQEDFDRMVFMIKNNVSPYVEGYNKLVLSPYSNYGVKPNAVETVIRGGQGDNVKLLYTDIAYAFQNALRWKLEGSKEHGDTARDILNAWAHTLKNIGGNADRYLAAGLFGYQLANVAEIMRDYPGFDVPAMKDMLINVFYKPMNERFLISNEYGRDHNDAYITNYWANWDLCNMASCVAIGIFTDRKDIFDVGINYFKNGAGNGSIYHAIPYVFEDENLAQWQESGRDQGHANLGIGLMASVCEMAWNQGIDLYSYANNRFMYAAEYVAKYNNGEDVPFVTYEWGTGQRGDLQSHTAISDAGRGEMRPIWEMIYNHYANRKGYSVPNIAKRAGIMRPEGGPGGHATTFDQVGFGTLLYTREKKGEYRKVPEGEIKDGVYRIISTLSKKAVEAKEGEIVQSEKSENDAQKWVITHLGGGEYSIINAAENLALEVNNSSYENGAKLVMGEFKDRNNQRFGFIPKEENSFRIIPSHSGKALDVEGASMADGAKIIQYRYTLAKNQHFELELIKELQKDDSIKIFVRGKRLYMDESPQIINDRVMVPMRAIFEKLGVKVSYDDYEKAVFAKKDGLNLVIKINDTLAKVNDVELTLDTPPLIINDKTFVPARFVAESLGCTVIWNGDEKIVEINY